MPSLFSNADGSNAKPYPLSNEKYEEMGPNFRLMTSAKLTRRFEIYPGGWLPKGTQVYFDYDSSYDGKVAGVTLVEDFEAYPGIHLKKGTYVRFTPQGKVFEATLVEDFEAYPGIWLGKGTKARFTSKGKVSSGTLAWWDYADGAKKRHSYFSAGKEIFFYPPDNNDEPTETIGTFASRFEKKPFTFEQGKYGIIFADGGIMGILAEPTSVGVIDIPKGSKLHVNLDGSFHFIPTVSTVKIGEFTFVKDEWIQVSVDGTIKGRLAEDTGDYKKGKLIWLTSKGKVKSYFKDEVQ